MSKTAIIILDFINGFTQGSLFKEYFKQHQPIAKANQLIAHARQNKLLLIFVKLGFSDQYAELAHRSPMFAGNKQHGFLKLSDPQTHFDPELDYQTSDIVVIKHRINAFYATSLEAILNAHDIDHLILSGVSTNWAVEGTARDAHDRNYSVTIAKDACASHNNENQEKSLSILSRIAQIKTVHDICGQS